MGKTDSTALENKVPEARSIRVVAVIQHFGNEPFHGRPKRFSNIKIWMLYKENLASIEASHAANA
jgi:hypothetical protein